MDLAGLRQVLTRPGGGSHSAAVGTVALFIAYLLLAIPVGAAFLLVVLLSLPVWALTKDETTVT